MEIDINYYKFHIGDYASATRHLSWDEDMAYRRLLDAYYINEGPLPSESRSVYRLACATTEDQRIAVDTILEEFFTMTEDGWRHFRCDAEILSACEKGEKASFAARKRWDAERAARAQQCEVTAPGKRTQCEINADAMRTHTEKNADASKSDATHYPLPTTQDPIQNHKRVPRFDAFRHLVDIGVAESVARDWIALRKAKKATPTQTAIDGVLREAKKAGMDLGAALTICCERGWSGFKSDWVTAVSQSVGRMPAMDNFANKDYGQSGAI